MFTLGDHNGLRLVLSELFQHTPQLLVNKRPRHRRQTALLLRRRQLHQRPLVPIVSVRPLYPLIRSLVLVGYGLVLSKGYLNSRVLSPVP